jgi:hypothetical protein
LVKYGVTFTETGLPAGTAWSVTVGGTYYSTNLNQISAELPNATYSWKVGIVPGWTPSSSAGSITINGAGVNVPISFNRTVYAVSFVESGLNSNALWNVTFNGSLHFSRSGSIAFSLPNGTYSFTVGKRWGWSVSPISGVITVSGSAVNENILFVPIPTYTVTFQETGIAPGVRWDVNLTNTSDGGLNSSYAIVSSSVPWSSSISLEEFNGRYSYTTYSSGFEAYSWSTSSPITVNGNNIVVRVYFKQITYGVWFIPSGLPFYESWNAYLNVNGNIESGNGYYTPSQNGSIEFVVGNGTYSYSVPALNGYRASPSSGEVGVAGGSVSITVDFIKVAYTIWFNATGLQSGATWYVNVSGVSFRGNSPSIAIEEYNGLYYYSASANGYTSSSSS